MRWSARVTTRRAHWCALLHVEPDRHRCERTPCRYAPSNANRVGVPASRIIAIRRTRVVYGMTTPTGHAMRTNPPVRAHRRSSPGRFPGARHRLDDPCDGPRTSASVVSLQRSRRLDSHLAAELFGRLLGEQIGRSVAMPIGKGDAVPHEQGDPGGDVMFDLIDWDSVFEWGIEGRESSR
jgi:hypothetical protein